MNILLFSGPIVAPLSLICGVLWGGRGIVFGHVMLLAVIILYLTWGFAYKGIEPDPANMGYEQLLLLALPLMWLAGSLWALFVYLLLWRFGWLRHARRLSANGT